MPFSNAEKQVRFRKKEGLNKYVSEVFRDCQFRVTLPQSRTTPADLEAQLLEAANLPSGWTDKDLELAKRRIRNINVDILGAGNPIGDDVSDGRNTSQLLRSTPNPPNPQKWLADIKKAERDAIALAGHLISAIELSQLRNEDCAAALLEAGRHVGRALANSNSDGKSDAMAVCLATVSPHNERPNWFIKRLADWLRKHLDDDSRKALGEHLVKESWEA
jgi:hypothetical protein